MSADVRAMIAAIALGVLAVSTVGYSVSGDTGKAVLLSLREASIQTGISVNPAEIAPEEIRLEEHKLVPDASLALPVQLVHLPEGMKLLRAMAGEHEWSWTFLGDGQKSLVLNLTETHLPVTHVQDYVWRQTIQGFEGTEALMYAPKDGQTIRIAWRIKTESGWKNFVLIGHNLDSSEMESVFKGIQW